MTEAEKENWPDKEAAENMKCMVKTHKVKRHPITQPNRDVSLTQSEVDNFENKLEIAEEDAVMKIQKANAEAAKIERLKVEFDQNLAVFKVTCTEADVAKNNVIFIENCLIDTKDQVEKKRVHTKAIPMLPIFCFDFLGDQ